MFNLWTPTTSDALLNSATGNTGGSVGCCSGSTTRFEDDEEEALAFSMSIHLATQMCLRYFLAHVRTRTIARILSSDRKVKSRFKSRFKNVRLS